MRPWLTYTFLITLFFICSSSAFAVDDNSKLNSIYTHFAEAYDRLDSTKMKQLYAEDACYIPEKQEKRITTGRKNIIALYDEFFGKIRHKEAKIEVDFRVIERNINGNSATDVGYYLIRFHPAADTEEQVSEFAGKFVSVSKKKADGNWYLTVDTNNRAEAAFYYDAKPSPNLYYGRQFTPLHTATLLTDNNNKNNETDTNEDKK